jgi:hypothetical protein
MVVGLSCVECSLVAVLMAELAADCLSNYNFDGGCPALVALPYFERLGLVHRRCVCQASSFCKFGPDAWTSFRLGADFS